MKKKILALCLVVVLAVTAVTGVTLAYFTDVEHQTNEFAVGNVKIDLYEDVKQDDGTGRVIVGEQTLGEGTDENPGIKYENIQPGHKMTKVAHVKNTGANDAYVALVIKQENYLNFNRKIDDYYEAMSAEEWKALGLEGTDVNTVMQEITNDVFPNWHLLYDKYSVAAPNAQVRYTIDTLPTCDDPGVKVLGVGYANNSIDAKGEYYNYSGEYFTNGKFYEDQTGEPVFMSISNPAAGDHDRVWIVYLVLAPGAEFDMDLTTVCPTYFDNDSTTAFEGMTLDIKSFAIQTASFADAKDAFAEVLKAEDVFAY